MVSIKNIIIVLFIFGWIACIHAGSEEQNYLLENSYGTEHIVTSVTIL